jgi:hypothetical protein
MRYRKVCGFESHLGHSVIPSGARGPLSMHISCCVGPFVGHFNWGCCCGQSPPCLPARWFGPLLLLHKRTWLGQHDPRRIGIGFRFGVVACSPGSPFRLVVAFLLVHGGPGEGNTTCALSPGNGRRQTRTAVWPGVAFPTGSHNMAVHVAHEAHPFFPGSRVFPLSLFMVTCGVYFMTEW